MKQFLVFAGDQYHPTGGWGDLRGAFDTQIEAEKFAEVYSSMRYVWYQIVDLAIGKIILEKS